MKNETPIYMAYGSNLNIAAMNARCPDARSIGVIDLKNWRLVFRGVADIIPAPGFSVPIGLWRITPKCEKRLDTYEGYPSLYRKKYFLSNGRSYMAYIMNRSAISPPMSQYYQSIEKGYEDFEIPKDRLVEALTHSHTEASGIPHHPARYKKKKTA